MNWLTNLDWSQALAFLLDNALKGSVVIVVAAGIAWMLRKSTAAARHSVWSAAVAAQLLIPALVLVLPTWRVPVLDEPAWVTPDALGTTAPKPDVNEIAKPADPVAVEQSSPVTPISTATQTTSPPSPRVNISPVLTLAALWLLGCIAVLVRLALGTAVVSRMAGKGQRVTDEKWLGLLHRLAVTLNISRPLTLLRGDALGVPVTWGIVYPVVLLPEDADSWPEDRRRYVLVHEMAHVKRLDAFTQLVAQVTLAVFWFNPLVWMAAAQMRRERENACDDYVITHGTKPSMYASDLLELVQEIDTDGHRSAAPAFAALAMARRSEFEGRMLSILNPRIRRNGLTRKGVVMGLLSTLIVAAPLAAFSPYTLRTSPQNDGLPERFRISFKGDSTNGVPSATITPVVPETKKNSAIPSQRTISSGTTTERCDRVNNHFTGTSTNIHDSNERPETRVIRFVQRRQGRCVEANLNGVVAFTDDERDIESVGRGAMVRFREVTTTSDREITITSDGDRQNREYFVNGKAATLDAEGRNWLASMILTTVRESAYNAPERVRRLNSQGGADRVLAEIDAIVSSGAKRDYYEAFLQLGSPTEETVTRVLTRVKRDLAESSGDMRTVLEKIPGRLVRTAQARSAFAEAALSIDSDGDKATLLTELIPTADRDLLLDLINVAGTIDSDGDKARVLVMAAAMALNPQDPPLHAAYFRVAASIQSDGDLARVLISAAPFGHASAGVTEAVLNTARGIESDGDKANVLTYVATQRLLTTNKVKDLYMEVARTIESEGDRTRVLRAAMIG